jgi:hypothetical protein
MGFPRNQECEILHTSCELFIGHNGSITALARLAQDKEPGLRSSEA